MKIVLSRKGFDKANGGMPSPILPNGTLLSLPIPSKQDSIKYSEIYKKDKSLFELIKELKPSNNIKEKFTCHLDPDIFNYSLNKTWKPLFGQEKAAQTHLENNLITLEDLFLFFGWFKQTEYVSGKLQFKKGTPDLHIIWGYLQIGKIYQSLMEIPSYLHYHPHANRNRFNHKNCIYQATEKLSLNELYNGYGTFKYHSKLVLTKSGLTRSKWSLPDEFKNLTISYHKKKSFKDDYFDSAKIGQEFVIQENDFVSNWALNIISKGLGISI